MSSFTASVLPRQFERRHNTQCHNNDRDPQDVAKHVVANLRRHWNKKNDDNDRGVNDVRVVRETRMKDEFTAMSLFKY
jgi:hypothetical protein